MKIDQFMKKAAEFAVAKLVAFFVKETKNATEFNQPLTAKAVAAITVMQALEMLEAVKYFRLYIIATCGRLGVEVPDTIRAMYSPAVSSAASVSTVPTVVSDPKPALVPPAPVKGMAKEAPAREINKPFNPVNALATWLGQLGGIARGSAKNPPWPTIQSTATKLFQNGVELNREQWETIFMAMKKAAENGRYILDSHAVQGKTMRSAPADLLGDFLFGQGGAVMHLITELRSVPKLEKWHVARTYGLLDTLDIFDRLVPEDGIGDQEFALVEKLEKIVGKLNPPRDLSEKFETLLGPSEVECDRSELEAVHEAAGTATATIGAILQSKAS